MNTQQSLMRSTAGYLLQVRALLNALEFTQDIKGEQSVCLRAVQSSS